MGKGGKGIGAARGCGPIDGVPRGACRWAPGESGPGAARGYDHRFRRQGQQRRGGSGNFLGIGARVGALGLHHVKVGDAVGQLSVRKARTRGGRRQRGIRSSFGDGSVNVVGYGRCNRIPGKRNLTVAGDSGYAGRSLERIGNGRFADLRRIGALSVGIHGGCNIIIGLTVVHPAVGMARSRRLGNKVIRTARCLTAVHGIARGAGNRIPGQADLAVPGDGRQSRRRGWNCRDGWRLKQQERESRYQNHRNDLLPVGFSFHTFLLVNSCIMSRSVSQIN